jgi:electron transport complex protein RnfE
VNCLILGRQESFASKNGVLLSLADAVGMAGGFTLALAMIGGIREILGNGSLLGYPLFGDGFEPWVIMILPPGGFFTLGALILSFSWFAERSQKKKNAQKEQDASQENIFESWVV